MTAAERTRQWKAKARAERQLTDHLCECGCGEYTYTAIVTDRRKGHVRGQPLPRIQGHGNATPRSRRGARERAERRARREAVTPEQRAQHRKDAQRVRSRRWAAAHPERDRAAKSRHQARNRDRINAAARAREAARQTRPSTEWRRAHPEAAKMMNRIHQAARRARKRDQFVENVDPMEVLLRDEGICGICRERVDPRDFHVDHIVALVRGGEHSYANVQTAHPCCNLQKGRG